MSIAFAGRKERLTQLRSKRAHLNGVLIEKESLVGVRCPKCSVELNPTAPETIYNVCSDCGHHLSIGAYNRLEQLMDADSFRELAPNMHSIDPLSFPKYGDKLEELKNSTGLKDAVVAVNGKIGGYGAVVVVLDSRFLMGSMGAVVGEKVTYAVEKATKYRLPLIIFSASGGARMQEGIISLMQMAKTCSALQQFSVRGGLYISILTHPTTGGVTASFASMGDITLAEPDALIGFAGPRVIEQTIGQKLPEGFQRSEFLQQHGFVDRVVKREDMRDTLIQLLRLHS